MNDQRIQIQILLTTVKKYSRILFNVIFMPTSRSVDLRHTVSTLQFQLPGLIFIRFVSRQQENAALCDKVAKLPRVRGRETISLASTPPLPGLDRSVDPQLRQTAYYQLDLHVAPKDSYKNNYSYSIKNFIPIGECSPL